MIIVCPKAVVKSHEAYWTLRQVHPILSARRDVNIRQSRVLGLKRAWLSEGSLSKASLAALSAASFPRIPTVQEST